MEGGREGVGDSKHSFSAAAFPKYPQWSRAEPGQSQNTV